MANNAAPRNQNAARGNCYAGLALAGDLADIAAMIDRPPPNPLRALLPLFVVQFACWSAMFLMWIAAYPLITLALLGAHDSGAGLKVMALCFAGYAGLAACLAFAIPVLLARITAPVLLGLAALVGAGGLVGLGLARAPIALLPCFAAVAVGWAALSNLPYTIAVGLLPETMIDHGLRVFSFSTIVPQIAITALIVFLIGPFDAVTARALMLLAGAALALGGVLALALRRRLGG